MLGSKPGSNAGAGVASGFVAIREQNDFSEMFLEKFFLPLLFETNFSSTAEHGAQSFADFRSQRISLTVPLSKPGLDGIEAA